MKALAAAALSLLAMSGIAAPPELPPPDALSLKTGGSPLDARFTVELSAAGLLKVHRGGPPHVEARTIELRIPSAETSALLSLASRSEDFPEGCGHVADGTAATMTVTYAGVRKTFSCIGAHRWPNGRSTREFLSALNRRLPAEMQVF